MKKAKAKKTLKDYELYLNDLYSEMSEDQAFNSLIYLTSKRRNKHITTNNLRKQYNLGKLGTLVRKYDSISFMCGFREFE